LNNLKITAKGVHHVQVKTQRMHEKAQNIFRQKRPLSQEDPWRSPGPAACGLGTEVCRI
jgi:hypothetical protein